MRWLPEGHLSEERQWQSQRRWPGLSSSPLLAALPAWLRPGEAREPERWEAQSIFGGKERSKATEEGLFGRKRHRSLRKWVI